MIKAILSLFSNEQKEVVIETKKPTLDSIPPSNITFRDSIKETEEERMRTAIVQGKVEDDFYSICNVEMDKNYEDGVFREIMEKDESEWGIIERRVKSDTQARYDNFRKIFKDNNYIVDTENKSSWYLYQNQHERDIRDAYESYLESNCYDNIQLNSGAFTGILALVRKDTVHLTLKFSDGGDTAKYIIDRYIYDAFKGSSSRGEFYNNNIRKKK